MVVQEMDCYNVEKMLQDENLYHVKYIADYLITQVLCDDTSFTRCHKESKREYNNCLITIYSF